MMSVDLMIIALFLVVTLSIGFTRYRGEKTFKDFAIGDGLPLFVLICLVIRGGFNLEMFGSTISFAHKGISQLGLCIIIPITLYLGARVVIVRMKELRGSLSIAEAIGKIYGPMIRKLAALSTLIWLLSNITYLFRFMLDMIYHSILPTLTDPVLYLIGGIVGVIAILYTALGGARPIGMANIFYFFCYSGVFGLIGYILLRYAQIPIAAGWAELQQLPQFTAKSIFSADTAKEYMSLSARVIVGMVSPFAMQSFLMAKSVQQGKKAVIAHSVAEIYTLVVLCCLGLLLHIGGHHFDTKKVWFIKYIITLAQDNPAIRGLLCIMLLAVDVSAIDRTLHLIAVVVVNDLLPSSLFGNEKNDARKIKTSRLLIITIGAIALSIVLFSYIDRGIPRDKIMNFYVSTVGVPFTMAVLGFRPRKNIILFVMAAMTLGSLHNLVNDLGYTYRGWIMISFCLLVGSHYLWYRLPYTGWVDVGDRSAIVLQWQECKRWWKRQWNNIQMVFTTEYFASCFPNKASSFMLWGGYFMGSALLSLCFIEKGYFEHYFYWYIALIEISIIIFAYPSSTLYFSKPRIMYFIWSVLLFMLFFVTGIQLAKMGHFRPMACALLICHFMASTCFFARKISIIMLAAAVALHTYISFDIPWDNIHWILLTEGPTWELMAASLLVGIAIAGFGTYKYLNDRTSARAKVMKVAEAYERRLSLQAIHNQINWYRLAPIQHSAMLRDINETLKNPYNYLLEQNQHKMGEELAGVMKKIRKTGSLLLQRDKEERSLRISEKAIQSVDIASIISKAHNNIHDLGESLQLLVYYQSKVKTIETDPELLERLLTINLLAISKSEHAVDPLVNLVIRSTNLHYNDATHRLPAIAFRMSTNIHPQGIYVVAGEYLLLDEGTPIFLPRTETELYQSESKQIVQAHGGYSEIIENEDSLTCLYVLPVAGKSVGGGTNI